MLIAVILTKNEEQNIEGCIKSVQFCNEILIIDDNSTDKTVEIARKRGVKVYSHPLNNDFAAQRNFALTKAKGDWVLFIDADERVTPKLAKEILRKTKSTDISGFLIKRQDIWLGKKLKYGEFGETCLLRLGRRNEGKWVRAVHEHWLIDGNISKLKHSIVHYPHKTVSEFIRNINYYSKLHAQENYKEGKSTNFWQSIYKPIGKFFFFFILKKGYKDGVHGFVAAMLMSFHSFLALSDLWVNKNYLNSKNS